MNREHLLTALDALCFQARELESRIEWQPKTRNRRPNKVRACLEKDLAKVADTRDTLIAELSVVWDDEHGWVHKQVRYIDGCPTCDVIKKSGGFGPSHFASERCESGKHNHCSCDVCF